MAKTREREPFVAGSPPMTLDLLTGLTAFYGQTKQHPPRNQFTTASNFAPPPVISGQGEMAEVNDERRSKRRFQTKIVVGQVSKAQLHYGGRRGGIGRSLRYFPVLCRSSFRDTGQIGKQPLLLLLASAWRLPVDF